VAFLAFLAFWAVRCAEFCVGFWVMGVSFWVSALASLLDERQAKM
jgi:hypothetical protein